MTPTPMSAHSRPVILTPKAQTDIENISVFGRQHWGDERASDYVEALYAALQTLGDFSELGRTVAEVRPGLRSHRVR